VCREAHELDVLEQLPAHFASILDDHRLHLIEQQLGGHATERSKGFFEPSHQNGERLPRVELQPHLA
jgi:hypothetical protein